jgi:hypothetical protein
MSDSVRHHEARSKRANQKEKENRMQRNTLRKKAIESEPRMKVVRKRNWLTRFAEFFKGAG